MTPDILGTDRKSTNEKTPHLKISVMISPGYGEARCIDEVSEETVIKAIGNEMDTFDSAFQKEFFNSKLTKSEIDILKTYLWWRTKKYVREFSQEMGGMVIDEHGSVRLVAADIRISRTTSEDGQYRVYDNVVTLTERGQEDHDKLVKSWLDWRKSKMVLTGTLICEQPCCFSRNRFFPVPRDQVKETVPGYAGDPP